MFIFTERHGDGLPQFSGTSHHDWRRLGAPNPDYTPVTGLSSKGNASTSASPTGDCAGHTKSHAVNALSLQHLQRQQALDELLNDIREWRSASHPALRAFWRTLALHDIRRFRRDFLRPERAAFEAAVRRSKLRRAA